MPGDYLTLVFKVNGAVDSVTAGLTLPEGWYLLSQMQVPSRNGLSFYYSIASKNKSRASLYPVKFEVFVQGVLQDTRKVEVPVREVSRIEILSISSPEYAKEGETLFSEFAVQNLGNRVEKLRFSSTGGIIDGEYGNISLEPGESIRVRLKKEVPHTDKTSWTLSQGLAVYVEGMPEPYRKYISMPVYSSTARETDNHLRFPVEAGASFLQYRLGELKSNGYQYFVKGNGSLDFKNRHLLDFHFRGPDQLFFPVLGSYDHYSLAYAYKDRFKVIGGDFYLSFNNLMELGRYGRGVYVQGRSKNLGARAFYQRARFFPLQRESNGAEATFFLKNGGISASWFSRNTFARNQWFTTRMIGLSAGIKKETVDWEAELSVGKALNRYDAGVFNRLTYSRRKFMVSNNLIYTGKNYFGFYHNSRLLVSGIGYFFNTRAGVGVTHNYMFINPGLDVTVFNTSPFTNSYMGYFTFNPNARNRFFLNYTFGDRKDRQEPSAYDYHENFGNLSYNFEGRRIRSFHQFRYGFTRNNLAQNDGLTPPRKTYASTLLQPSFRLFGEMWLSGYLEHQYTSRFSGIDQLQHLFYWGGNLNMIQNHWLQLNLMYRNSYAPDELYQSRTFLNASMVIDLKHHRISFQGGHIFQPNRELKEQNTLYFSLTYALKLNVPIARRKNTGRVVGKVTGLSPDIGKDGMLIRLGGREYLTDPTGTFSFHNLAEDKYLLTLQRMHAVEGVIPTVKIPMEIVVTKDSVTYLEIPLSKTGAVKGRVKFSEENTSPDKKPLVLLKLYNEETSFMTDLKEGHLFSFKEILPGSWKLKAILSDPGYEVEMEEQAITVQPGRTAEVTFVIRSKGRKIFFSNQNFQISLKE